ncbi:MAG: Gfo/Idh/MocA family oxidoreductase [Oscillospiraceae bacterium]
MKIGVIGYGSRVSSMFEIVKSYDLGAEITAIMDIDFEAVKERLKKYGQDETKIAFYDDAVKMLDEEELDGVMIGTRCSTHTLYAVEVLKRDIPLFLEKPVSTKMEDLILLQKASETTKSQVVVSFPLRVTPIVIQAKEIIDSGKIGTVENVQAINNVPYGGVYYHHWYRDDSITGGLFMQKATHDFDYINYILGTKPTMVCAMESKQIFKGDKPVGLNCKTCAEQYTCPEGAFVMEHLKYDSNHGYNCCYAKDTGNHDSASAIVRYESGMHVSYSQNFYARKEAAARGARFLGYNGTVEFDWYKDEIKVFMHDASGSQTYKLNTVQFKHGGGDEVLALNFLRVMQKAEKSVAPLEDGILSALMCLKAKESAESNQFVDIKF